MIDTAPRQDASLPDLLAARARHASDARLALDAAGGLFAVIAAVWWHGPAWVVIASAAGCFLAFGLWGIADRELGERGAASGAAGGPAAGGATLALLRAARALAVAIGTLSVVALLLVGLGIALGRMIS